MHLQKQKILRVLRSSAVCFLGVLSCRREQPQAQAPKQATLQIETPLVDKSIEAADADPTWLAGTWQKQGENRWYLFNLPADVAELKGKPARVVRRGKLVIHGAFIDAIFDREEVHFEASPDRSELRGDGVYRRGAPP